MTEHEAIELLKSLAVQWGYKIVKFEDREEVYDPKGRLVLIARKPDENKS